MPIVKSEWLLYTAVIVLLILILAHFSQSHVDIYKKYLYFDYNGTTPPHKAVVRKQAESAWLGNPSGVYAKQAKAAVESARNSVAEWLVSPNEGISQFQESYKIIFNSGASEGNNHVIRSAVERSSNGSSNGSPHIVMSSVEHKTSIDCAKRMQELGVADITFVDPAADGRIDPASLGRAINERTVLVSVMHYNNETGAINDIAAMAQAVQIVSSLQNRHIMFHVDAVQSFGKTPIPMSDIGIDALTMSFHKIYGPAGLGVLILRDFKVPTGKIALSSQITGAQNNGLRGGTENTAAIAAVPDTMNITMRGRSAKNARLLAYKNHVVQALSNHSSFAIGNYAQYYGQSDDYDPFNGLRYIVPPKERYEIVFMGPTTSNGLPDPITAAPNTLYLAVVKYAPLSEHFCNIVLRDTLFEKHRVITSIGSACSADAGGGSHVLTAIKAPYIIRCGVLRISFGDPTTWAQVRKLCTALISAIEAQSY